MHHQNTNCLHNPEHGWLRHKLNKLHLRVLTHTRLIRAWIYSYDVTRMHGNAQHDGHLPLYNKHRNFAVKCENFCYVGNTNREPSTL